MQTGMLSTGQQFVSQNIGCRDYGEISSIHADFALGDSRKSLRLWVISRKRDSSQAETVRQFVDQYIPYEENFASMVENAKEAAQKQDSAFFIGSRSAWYVILSPGYYLYTIEGLTGKTREIGGDRLLTLHFGNASLLQNVHLIMTSGRLKQEPRFLGKLLDLHASGRNLVDSIATEFSISGPIGILSKIISGPRMTPNGPATLAYVSSDRGQVRETNEDCGSVVSLNTANEQNNTKCTLAGVADGVGGLAAGEIASRLAITAGMGEMAHGLVRDSTMDPSSAFTSVFESANEKILKVASYTGKSMASTLSMGIVREGKVWTGNVGDTRIYGIRSRANEILQLTTDHRLEKEGPQSHVITRSLGSREHVPDVSSSFDMQEGDFLVACSDGLHDLVGEAEILDVALSSRNPRQICSGLTSRANSRGGKDNITIAILLWKGSLNG